MRYLFLLLLIISSSFSYAQIDTCAEKIHAVSDTPCSNRILHLAIEADTLPNTTYTWEGPGGWTASGDSVIRDSINATGTGYYIVTGTRGICIYKDTINVFIRSTPAAPFIAYNNSPICMGDTLKVQAMDAGGPLPTYYLDPSGNNIPSAFPSFGSLIIPDMHINMAGIYFVFFGGIQGCYSDTVSFNVEVDSCALNVADADIDHPFIPTILQPSDPIFKPIFKLSEAFKMHIYDQSGRKIFETNNGEGWDRSAYQGMYYYIITYQTSVYKGRIMLR